MLKLWQIFVKVCTFAQTAGRLEAKPEDEQTKLPCHKCLQNKLIIRRNLLCPSHASWQKEKRRLGCHSCRSSHASVRIRCQVSKINNIRKIQKLARMSHTNTHTHRETDSGTEGQTDGDILPNMRGANKLPSNMSGKPSKKYNESGAKAEQSKANETRRNET